MDRYVREDELIADAIKATRRYAREANRPTGTEKARTTEVAQQAAFDADFAKDLAEQLETELGPLPGQVQSALDDAADALAAAGLAMSEAATALSAAQDAADAAGDAVEEALAAAALVAGSNTWSDRAPVAADGDGKPLGAVWFQMDGSGLIAGFWELQSIGWISRDMSESVIPQIAIGAGTYGELSGSRLVARSILAGHIAALTITANELAANSVTAVKIAANSVTAVKINAGAVTTDKLYAFAVTAEKIAAGAIIAEKIAAGAIIAEKIAAGAITTAKLAATAIDGMTITGALIRTAATGQRLQFDINGLQAYDSSGNVVSTLSSQSGLFRVQSAAVPGRSESTLYLATNQTSGGLAQVRGDTSMPTSQSFPPYFDLSAAQDSAGFSRLSLGSGSQYRGTDHDSFLRIIARAGIPGIRSVDIETGNTDTPLNVGLPGGDLRFWGSVSFEEEGDTGFNSASGTTLGAASFIHREHSGLIYFNLVATRSAWGSTQLLATIPLNYRPSGTMSYPATINGAGAPYVGFVQVTTNGQVTLHTTPANGTTWVCNVAGFFKVA